MLLFPADIKALQDHLDERLDFDPKLLQTCQPLIESEDYAVLPAAAGKTLAQRISQKSGVPADNLASTDWAQQIDWAVVRLDQGQVDGLVKLCQSLLDAIQILPADAKTGRAVLLLTDVLLAQLDRLPDLAAPSADLDERPFFEELVKSLNQLLPYEQRDFPAEIGPTQAKLLLFNLPENAYYAVEIKPPADDEEGRLAMGIHFEADDLEKLIRHFQRKVPGLAHSMGGKEVVMEEGDGRLSILLHQAYHPEQKMSAFMTAATLVGFIGSIQERMPRR